MQYLYDIYGNTTGISYQETGKTIQSYKYVYNNYNMVTKTTLPTASTLDYRYDEILRSKNVIYKPMGANANRTLTTSYTFQKDIVPIVDGKNTTVTTNAVDTYTNKIGSRNQNQFQYRYDTHGNIISITDKVKGITWTYTYDEYEQLLSETKIVETKTVDAKKNTTNQRDYTTYTYGYDLGGNITSETITGKITLEVKNAKNVLTKAEEVTETKKEETHTYRYGTKWTEDGVTKTYNYSNGM